MKAVSLLCPCLLLVAGCATDREPLDRFSRAYTRFRDVGQTAYEAVQLAFHPESEYWQLLPEATDVRATNRDRARLAGVAMETYRRETAPLMTVSMRAFGSMDSSITALIEAANRIKNQEARARAVETAQRAREMQTALGRFVAVAQRRFEMQIALLQDLVSGDGAISAIDVSSFRADEAMRLKNESDEKWREVTGSWRKTKDAFAALKGRFDLKSYPSRWDSMKTVDEASRP
jgi:hypothetical protein